MRRLLISGALVAALSMEGLSAAQPPPAPAPPAAAQPPPAPAAPAPGTPAPDPFRLDETVEVTATRSATGTNQSPASSTVVLRSDLERRDVIAVDQALTTVEGVYAYRQRGVPDNEVGIGMRGFSGRGTGQSRVLILLDGQPINNSYTGAVNWTALPLGEVERIEVVRGPYSALYGGNAMGGVVNVITRPIARRSAELDVQGGTFGTWNYSARAGGRLGTRLGLAVGVDGLRTDGYRSQEVLRTATDSTATAGVPVTGVERFLTRTGTVNYAVGMRGRNTYDRLGLRARAEYMASERTFGSVQWLRQQNEFGWGPYESSVRTAAGTVLETGAVVFQDGGVWKRATLSPSNYLGVVGGGTSQVAQGQLLHSTDRVGQWRLQFGVNMAPRDWTGAPGASATGAGGPGTETVQRNRGTFANLQWSQVVASRHTVSVGVDARVDRAEISVFPTTSYLGSGALSVRDTYTFGRGATWALYAQDTLALNSRITITGGGRLDLWQTSAGESQPAPGASTVRFPDRRASAVTGKVAALFTLRTGTVLRASAGTAFRNPSVFDLYRDLRLSSGTLLLGNPNVNPERMRSGEVGLRHDWHSRLSTDVAYYENHITDLIFRSLDLAADPTGFTQRMLNAGRARTRGVELAATARPLSWLTARPTYTFTSALITRNDPSPLTVGKAVPFVPRHTAAGTVTAVAPRVTATLTGRYQTAVFATDTNADTVRNVPGAYDLFFEMDAAVNVTLVRQLQLTVSAENVLDRRYYLFYRNPGRMVYAGLRVRY
jgi:iron complex outermembrane receptor protein